MLEVDSLDGKVACPCPCQSLSGVGLGYFRSSNVFGQMPNIFLNERLK